MMKKFLFLFLCVLTIPLFAAKVDLNSATFAELKTLPITEQQARDIYDYKQNIAYFENIYDLRKVSSIDQQTLEILRPLITIAHYIETDDSVVRREQIGYLLQRMDANEGSQEGMSDVWEDFLMTPQNANGMFFNDYLSLPNVSPVDAFAVMRRRAQGDTLADQRDLKNSPGLSYYGYSNMKNYVYYKEPPIKDRIFVDYQLKYLSLPFEDDQLDMYKLPFLRYTYGTTLTDPFIANLNHKDRSYWGYFHLNNFAPSVMNKIRVRYGNNIKAGALYDSPMGEKDIINTDVKNLLEDGKFYAGYENTVNLLGATGIKGYFGNYRVTYGEGLCLDNTDYYTSRNTGYGFTKRILGVTPDLSRTQEYSMKGLALELRKTWMDASFFYSRDKKDAIVYMSDSVYTDGTHHSVPKKNPDGTYQVLGYVTATQSFDNDALAKAEDYFNAELRAGDSSHQWAVPFINLAPRQDFLSETVIGGHLTLSPFVGTNLGFTTYTSFYDNTDFVVPDNTSLKQLLIRDNYNYKYWKIPSNEISSLYSTKNGSYNRDYRRLIGLDWMTVIKNTSFSGEYAELSVSDGQDLWFGDDPHAVVLTTYTQFDNLYLLSLYRNYDLKFDNPYSRAFSEHQKLTNTILDDYGYTLTNPLLSDMVYNNAQAQAERGFYFETRYRFNSYFTLGKTYVDIWERLCDHRKSVRFQGDLDYRPLYQLSLRLKYKKQINRYDDTADRAVSKTDEYTASVATFLSARDYLSFEYRYNTVWGPPYLSITNPAEATANDQANGSTQMTGDFVAVNYDHNFNDNFSITGSVLYWNGHGISHWDWEDIEIDFMGQKGMKYWFTIQDQLAHNLFFSFKYKYKEYQTLEELIRQYNVPYPDNQNNYFQRVERVENEIRLQLDWKF
jgi:hypothetical protein